MTIGRLKTVILLNAAWRFLDWAGIAGKGKTSPCKGGEGVPALLLGATPHAPLTGSRGGPGGPTRRERGSWQIRLHVPRPGAGSLCVLIRFSNVI